MASSLLQPVRLNESEEQLVLREISAKHRLWAESYVANCFDAKKACEDVGYKRRYQNVERYMLSHPITGKFIQNERAKLRERNWIRHEQMLDTLERYNKCKIPDHDLDDPKEFDALMDECGEMFDQYEESYTGRKLKGPSKLKTFELELRMRGYDTSAPQQQVNINQQVNVNGNIDWDQMRQPVEEEGDVFDEVIEGHLESGNGQSKEN